MNTVLAKPPQQRECDDPGSRVGGAVSPRHHREGRLVQDGRLHAAERGEQDVIGNDAFDLGPGDQQQPGRDRAACHDGAAMATVDRAADWVRGKARQQQSDRHRAVKHRLRPAEIALHRLGDHGVGVIERSPRADLADAEPGDEEAAAAARSCGVPAMRVGRTAHAAAPQQATRSGVLVFDVASAAAVAGAGVPQQAGSGASAVAGVALQTPV